MVVVVIIVVAAIGIYFTLFYTTQEKVLVIGVTDKITDLDTASAYDFFTWEVLNNVMAGLVTYKPGTADLELALAASYQVQDNGKTYVFTLKDNLKFSDGKPLTAQDFVRSKIELFK